MRRTSLALVLAAAALIAGCGASGSSSPSFDGEQEAVANVVEDLQIAARDDETRRACRQLLSTQLTRSLGNGCANTIQAAFDEADTPDMVVESVRVSGDTARARVEPGRDGEESEARTLEFVREGRDWRISSFGG